MASLGDIQGQMTAQEGVMSQYTKDLPSQIEANIKEAWSPSMKEASGVVGQQISSFLPSYFGSMQSLGGTTAADISPAKRLQVLSQQVGTLGGELAESSRYADYLGARADEMYKKAYDAMQLGYQRESDAYNRLAQQYQYAWQESENEKNRQLQREQMARSGGGGGGLGDITPLLEALGGGQSTTAEIPQELFAALNNNIPRIGAANGVSAEQRKAMADQYIQQYIPNYQYLTNEQLKPLYKTAGFSDRILNQMFG